MTGRGSGNGSFRKTAPVLPTAHVLKFMKKTIWEHLFSLTMVAAIFLVLIVKLGQENLREQTRRDAVIEEYLNLDFLDFTNPLHKTLFKETLYIYYPGQRARNDSLVRAIEGYRARQIVEIQRRTRSRGIFSPGKLPQLGEMFLRFVLAYGVVMLLTYYGVQTLATLRFVKMKQGRTSYLAELAAFLWHTPFPETVGPIARYLAHAAGLLGKALIKAALYLVLFSPAYVIAYSFKTRFDTDTFFFMVLLGVVSNGLLVTYAHKFYTFLVGESRKGYVQTAMVKNLNQSYETGKPGGISRTDLFRIRKKFGGHVFGHIYQNANFQYLATIKEQASFVITGLVIIEMALNIQGHLCYELLQNLLFAQYDVALAIILGIFAVVKLTEIFADVRLYRARRRYANE